MRIHWNCRQLRTFGKRKIEIDQKLPAGQQVEAAQSYDRPNSLKLLFYLTNILDSYIMLLFDFMILLDNPFQEPPHKILLLITIARPP